MENYKNKIKEYLLGSTLSEDWQEMKNDIITCFDETMEDVIVERVRSFDDIEVLEALENKPDGICLQIYVQDNKVIKVAERGI